MNDTDRAIVAAAEERDRLHPAGFTVRRVLRDRRELLRIVREQGALLRERDAMDSDRADAEAAEREAEAEFLRPIR